MLWLITVGNAGSYDTQSKLNFITWGQWTGWFLKWILVSTEDLRPLHIHQLFVAIIAVSTRKIILCFELTLVSVFCRVSDGTIYSDVSFFWPHISFSVYFQVSVRLCMSTFLIYKSYFNSIDTVWAVVDEASLADGYGVFLHPNLNFVI